MRFHGAFRALARPAAAVGIIACALIAIATAPSPAQAEETGDIVLGVYFEADDYFRDTIYASYDGERFYDIATAHEHRAYDTNGYPHAGHACPSIMYHNGYFWMISSWNRYDGRFWPVISYSKDLVTWTYPEGDGMLTGTHGIRVDKYPTINGTTYSNFDVVAPEWHKASDGSIYIIFSAGYYGAFHGRPTQDRMQAYIVKVDELSASGTRSDGWRANAWPSGLVFRAGTAKRLAITETAGANYIDGALYEESGTTYLFLKKNGLTTQVYTTTNIDDPASWKQASASILYGYEGMSLVKLGSTYFGYVDRVTGATADGVRMIKSLSLTSQWSKPSEISYTGGRNVRHGSVILLKAGTNEWYAAKRLLDVKGVAPTRPVDAKPSIWVQEGGRWWYRRGDGSYPKSGWEQIDGKWYLFDADGWMLVGWQRSGGEWYYLESSGEMRTGWLQHGGKWYFLSPNKGGAMISGRSWEVQGKKYTLDASGAMVEDASNSAAPASAGWVSEGSRWWYRRGDGSYPKSGWEQIDGKWYLFDADGWMLVGWQRSGGEWYYLESSGEMRTGWLQHGGKWYFLSPNKGGAMISGRSWEIKGKQYAFDATGALID